MLNLDAAEFWNPRVSSNSSIFYKLTDLGFFTFRNWNSQGLSRAIWGEFVEKRKLGSPRQKHEEAPNKYWR